MNRKTRAFAGSLGVAAALALGASNANAATYTHCNDGSVAFGAFCQSFPNGDRHTYVNARTSWTDTVNYSCSVRVFANSYVAYTSSNASSAKYSAYACGYVNNGFGGNNELLRNYSLFDNTPSNKWLVGKGDW